MTLAPAGTATPNSGHHHLLIDTDVPADLSKPLPPGPVMGGLPMSEVVWAMIEHTAHHRGALTVYSRMLNKVPVMPYMG